MRNWLLFTIGVLLGCAFALLRPAHSEEILIQESSRTGSKIITITPATPDTRERIERQCTVLVLDPLTMRPFYTLDTRRDDCRYREIIR